MGLSFAIGILTFLLYLAIWYLCSSRRRRRRRVRGQRDGALFAPEDGHGHDHGMSAGAIAALPTFAHDGGADAQALDCPVRLGQVEAGEKVRRLPKCAHSFHADCVDAWYRAHSTCPICAAPPSAPPPPPPPPPPSSRPRRRPSSSSPPPRRRRHYHPCSVASCDLECIDAEDRRGGPPPPGRLGCECFKLTDRMHDWRTATAASTTVTDTAQQC